MYLSLRHYSLEYCLAYLQKIIEWLNRNAYIMIAIQGKSFCTSAWEALMVRRCKLDPIA